MKIAIMSDMHGVLPTVEPCDFVFICGDISPLHIQKNIVLMREWLKEDFAKWVNELPCKQVIMVAGNHDYILLDLWKDDYKHNVYIKHPTGNKLHLLENNHISIFDEREYIVWGSPYCHIFGNWPFMYNSSVLKEGFKTMPENCDFALTHDAPYGCSDTLLQPTKWKTPYHIGNKELRDAVIEKRPKYLFHGHLHSTNHECEMLEDTKVYNVSILDEYYEYKYPIKYITI